MASQRDYYDILGVKRDASADDIRAAYRKLARELHPDVNKADDAAQKFGELQQAYDVLSDESKRKNYDRFGAGGPGPGGNYAWTNVGGPGGAAASDFDIGSMFEEIFGAGGSGGAGAGQRGRSRSTSPFGSQARARSRPTRGMDLQQELVVDFMQAITGGSQSLRVRRGGSTQTIDVTIPKGVREGAKLRMKGLGAPSTTGGAPGDLLLTVHIAAHPYFRRSGDDILLDLPISIAEAALGATVSIPTIDGKRAEITVSPGASSGQRLRLRGQGIESDASKRGDMFAVIKIVAPTKISRKDRERLEKLGESLPAVRSGKPWND